MGCSCIGFVRGWLKFSNWLLLFVGLGMIGYAVYLDVEFERVKNKDHSPPPPMMSPPPSPPLSSTPPLPPASSFMAAAAPRYRLYEIGDVGRNKANKTAAPAASTEAPTSASTEAPTPSTGAPTAGSTEAPTDSSTEAPTTTAVASESPTTAAVASEAPTAASGGSEAPTASTAPTTSEAPTSSNAPTSSEAPTAAATPTTSPTVAPKDDFGGTSWFIYGLGGAGILSTITASIGHCATGGNRCLLNMYTYMVLMLLLGEMALAIALFTDEDLRHKPDNLTHRVSKVYDFVTENVEVVSYACLGIVVIELFSVIMACVLKASDDRTEDSDDDEDDYRRPLIRRGGDEEQPSSRSSRRGGERNGGVVGQTNQMRHAEWSERMREKFNLDTTKYSYNPADELQSEADSKSKCTIA